MIGKEADRKVARATGVGKYITETFNKIGHAKCLMVEQKHP